MTAYRSLNPATGEELESFPLAAEREIEGALSAAEAAFARWRWAGFDERAAILMAAADSLDKRRPDFARLISLEMGKILAESEKELERSSAVCRFFAEHAAELLETEERDSRGDGRALVAFEPLGPILAIMPWNFPFWQAFRCAAPALSAGNPIILKHAPNTPQCARAIASVFEEAGAPPGLFTNLFLSNEQAKVILEDRRIASASLTGSVRAGKSVGATAGGVIKRAVLELGGSDPFIVCEDADVERAAATAVEYRFMNSGQSCISPKRMIVNRAVLDRFVANVVEGASSRKVGDPFDPASQNGPVAREDLRDALLDQVQRSTAAGAKLLCGGKKVDRPGFFVTPGVMLAEASGLPARCEELFGPVAVVVPAQDDAEAVRIANETSYGLGGSIWTRDRERGLRLARQIEAGCVFVNGAVRSEPGLPFGGIKESGLGRELGKEGIREFVNVKNVRLFE